MPSVDTNLLITTAPKGTTSSSLKVKPDQKFQQIFDEEKFKAQTPASTASQGKFTRTAASGSDKVTSEEKPGQTSKANSKTGVEVQANRREVAEEPGKPSQPSVVSEKPSQDRQKPRKAELSGTAEGNGNGPIAELLQDRQDLPIADKIAGRMDESEAPVSGLPGSLLSASRFAESHFELIRSEAGEFATSDNLPSFQIVVPVAAAPAPETISTAPEIGSTEPNVIADNLDLNSFVMPSASLALREESVASRNQQSAPPIAVRTAPVTLSAATSVDLNPVVSFETPGKSTDPDRELAVSVTHEISVSHEPVSSALTASLGEDQEVAVSRPKPDSIPLETKAPRVGLIDKISQSKPAEPITVIAAPEESEGAASQNQAEPDRSAIGESAQKDQQGESATSPEALRPQKVPNPFLKELHAQLVGSSRSETPHAAEVSQAPPSITRALETSGFAESLRVSQPPSSPETPDAPTAALNPGIPAGASPTNAGLTERPTLVSNVAHHSNQVEKAGVISQLVEKAHLLAGRNQSEMTVVLKPEFLGRINLHAALVENSLVATITAESPAVKQLLESQLSTLQTALQEQGLPVTKVEVVQGNQLSFSEFSQGQASSQQNFETRQSQAIPFVDGGLEGELEEPKQIPTPPAIFGYESSRSIHFIV